MPHIGPIRTRFLMDYIQVDIIGLSTSPSSGGAYALVLGETRGNRRLPIIIGAFEAQAIALELEKIQPPRPMTHDLLHNLYDALGAEVTLCGPRTMIPVGIEHLGARVTDRLDEALEGCDVAMTLRIQLERQGAGPNGLFPSLREYHSRFGLRGEHLEANPDLWVMHPGPVNLGVELAGEVADSDRAVILDQVTNGVAVRMAVLYLLAGGTAARMQDASGADA